MTPIVKSTLIILSLVFAMVIIVVVVYNVASVKQDESDEESLDLGIVLSSVKVENNILTLSVKGDIGDEDLQKIKFVIFDGANSDDITIDASDFTGEKDFEIDLHKLGLLSVEKISIIPIVKRDGKDKSLFTSDQVKIVGKGSTIEVKDDSDNIPDTSKDVSDTSKNITNLCNSVSCFSYDSYVNCFGDKCNKGCKWDSDNQECIEKPVCGDGMVNGNETCVTCSLDVGACVFCGDGVCNGNATHTETYGGCPGDCSETCGDGVKDSWENCLTCPIDYGVCCGNSVLDNEEQCDDGNEVNTDLCKGDCTNNVCGDGLVYVGFEECDNGALNTNTPCSSVYDGSCSYCDGFCKQRVVAGASCGDGDCSAALGENCASCQSDCGICCGNGVCDNGETCSSCVGDCKKCNDASCSSDSDCHSNICGVDGDNDGYFSLAVGHIGICQNSAKPYTDCLDSNNIVHPGQTSYFETDRGDGSFDYDCNGVENKEDFFCYSCQNCQVSGEMDCEACPNFGSLYSTVRHDCSTELVSCGQAQTAKCKILAGKGDSNCIGLDYFYLMRAGSGTQYIDVCENPTDLIWWPDGGISQGVRPTRGASSASPVIVDEPCTCR
jgi:hypothetical protein